MQKIKKRWEILENWQFIFPVLGFLMVLVTAYTISKKLIHAFLLNNTYFEWPFTLLTTVLLHFVMVRCFLWCFKKLEKRWVVGHKWEMIAIFIVFAITGSSSAKLAGPLTHLIGIDGETTRAWLYWPVRILIILPIYQILLVGFGWLFGQFTFFWNFEKKLLKRMGLGFMLR